MIDATGDGDIAAKAGCPFEFGRPGDGRVQGMTMMYRVCGIDDAAINSQPGADQGDPLRNAGRQPARRTAAV